MSRLLLIDPFSGASGDMLLAALVDAGAPIDELRDQLRLVNELRDVEIDIETVSRGAFAAKRMVIGLPHEHAHRGLSDITRIIDGADGLGDKVKAHARDTFRRLAEVEARVHGTTVDEIHFHEVGALDAIVDIVGFYLAAQSLGVDSFAYTRIVLGSGSTGSAHGEIPVPSPATVELLNGHEVSFSRRPEELVTPTAAAIIANVFQPLPADARVRVGDVGYGAGTRESNGLPNVLRVTVGERIASPRHVAVVRCTIDDMTPEVFGHAMHELFELGALEVYFHPVMMKKNRPGVELTVIAEERDISRVGDYLLSRTTTLGLRVAREERVEIDRRGDQVETPLGVARVKIGTMPDGREKMSPEYESCKQLSESSGLSILEVFDIVRRSWTERDEPST